MEETNKREHVILYEVPLLPEAEVRLLIISSLPQAKLTPEDIKLRKKEGKYQAFVMVPSAKVNEICALK